MPLFIDRKMLQINTLQRAVRTINVNREIRLVLPIIRICSMELVALFIAELDTARPKKVTDLALFIRLAEYGLPVHILEKGLDPLLLPIEHISFTRGILKLVLHRIAGPDDVIANRCTEIRALLG